MSKKLCKRKNKRISYFGYVGAVKFKLVEIEAIFLIYLILLRGLSSIASVLLLEIGLWNACICIKLNIDSRIRRKMKGKEDTKPFSLRANFISE